MISNKNGIIIIPKPCSEDWATMNKVKEGKFCINCNKVVVDFTQISNKEIGHYFLTHSAHKTCGHFYGGQVITSDNIFHQKLLAGYCRVYQLKNSTLRYTALTMISFLLTITGCKNHNDEHHTTGDTTFVDSALVKQFRADSVSGIQKTDSLNMDTTLNKPN